MISYEQQLSNLRHVLMRKQAEMPARKAEWVELATALGMDPEPYTEPDYEALLGLIQAMENRRAYPSDIIAAVLASIDSHLKDKSDEEIYQSQILLGYKNMFDYFPAFLENREF